MADITTQKRAFLTDRQAAEMLSIGRSTLWTQVKAKRLPQPVKIGGATRWRASDLQTILTTPTAEPLPTDQSEPAAPAKNVEPRYLPHAFDPPKKTDVQIKQWAAYEALCAQRVEEAKARKAAGELVTEKNRSAEDIQHSFARHQRAQELRSFAATIMAAVDIGAPCAVHERAEQWRVRVMKLANDLDPTATIIASFSEASR